MRLMKKGRDVSRGVLECPRCGAKMEVETRDFVEHRGVRCLCCDAPCYESSVRWGAPTGPSNPSEGPYR